MGFEAKKTNRIRDSVFFETYFSGVVLDIGCGPDLVVQNARQFDIEHGDANRILDFLEPNSFDCVHSSHCLEHMNDVSYALAQWWALVKPGGYLVLVVPDEDLYEQGYWPSVFNNDHKATFRLDKSGSWSPVSYDVRRLVMDLPRSRVVDIRIQDDGYDYSFLHLRQGKFGRILHSFGRLLLWLNRKRKSVFYRLGLTWPKAERFCDRIECALGKPVAQTGGEALAQIQAVVQKQHE